MHIKDQKINCRLLLLLAVFLLSTAASAQYQVHCVSDAGQTMVFRAVGYGKNSKKASNDAELSVIKTLLFNGVPGTQQSLPLIPETEKCVVDNNGAFFNRFYGGEYKNVIMRSVIIRKFAKDGNKQKSITLEVTINIAALRSTLIKNNIIRKFGL